MERLKLFESYGEVIRISDFLSQFLEECNLTECERSILIKAKFPKDIPSILDQPLTRADWLKKSDKIIDAQRLGERSAYWKKYKFKGCNPSNIEKTFPSESFFFGQEKVVIKQIPYGILTPEEVMRELLGFAFFQINDLKTNIIPMCIYKYPKGYCIVEETIGEKRVESLFEFQTKNISELMKQNIARLQTKLRHGLETEVRLNRINPKRYTHQKAKILVEMNINGGFRGLLNSNIGNDVIDIVDHQLYLCDFDTFRVVEIPKKPDEQFLKRFFLQSFVEVVKSSLPIIDLVDNGDEAVKRYLEISSLYHEYRRQFFLHAKKRDWELEKIESWALGTPIFKRTVGEIVLSMERINQIPNHDPIYKPH